MASKFSKARRGGVRFLLVISLSSLLAGAAFFCFEKFDVLSLRNFSLSAPNPQVEKQFWELFPPLCLRYGPLYMFRFSQLQAFMEKTMPVNIVTESVGMGAMRTKISFLEPWLQVEWRGRLWYLSENGDMWDPLLLELKAPAGAIWRLPDTMERFSLVGNIEVFPQGVFPAVFSVEELKRFVGLLYENDLFKGVREVAVERRAGEHILKLSLSVGGQKISLVAQGDEQKWHGAASLLARVLPQIKKDGGNFVVDMTYSNKIVVARDVREGSSK